MNEQEQLQKLLGRKTEKELAAMPEAERKQYLEAKAIFKEMLDNGELDNLKKLTRG